MYNFTAIRNGLREHVKQGKLPPFELGIYIFLHMSCDYSSGIYQGCAMTIACNFGDPKLKAHVQKSLSRLRAKEYINFRKGDGKRHGYPILIDKYEVTVGEQSGKRLNAWKHGELVIPEYEPQNGHGTVVRRKGDGDETVVRPIQDLKTKTTHKKDKSVSENGISLSASQQGKAETRASGPNSNSQILDPDALANGLMLTWHQVEHITGGKGVTRTIREALDYEVDLEELGQTYEEVANWIKGRLERYFGSPKFKSKFGWSPITWFKDGHYRDDPASWQKGGRCDEPVHRGAAPVNPRFVRGTVEWWSEHQEIFAEQHPGVDFETWKAEQQVKA